MKSLSVIILGIFLAPSFATATEGKHYTYVCIANLYKRYVETDTNSTGDTFSQVNVEMISSIVSHWDGSKSGGGGPIFDGNQSKENGSVVIKESYLKDEDGREYEPVGMFDTSIGKSNLDVDFFDSKTGKKVGKTIRIYGTRSKSTEIAPNKFITVSCTFIPSIK